MHSIILSIAGGAQMKSMNQKDDKRMEWEADGPSQRITQFKFRSIPLHSMQPKLNWN